MNDFWIYEFEEETSIFDPKGYWVGLEYKARKYKVKVPNSISSDDEDALEEYLQSVEGDKSAWLD